MLKLLAFFARAYDYETVPGRPILSNLKVDANVCSFVINEPLGAFPVTVTLGDDGKVTEDCDGDVRVFDDLDEYAQNVVELNGPFSGIE